MVKRNVTNTSAARSNSSEDTRKRNNKTGKSPKPRTYHAAWCATCGQGPNDHDCDAPPGKQIKVKWCKFHRMVPVGQECLCCEMVRHKFWADWDQKALNTLLKHNSDERDAHAEARRAKVACLHTARCSTCEQSCWDLDRDALPRTKIKVKWAKVRRDALGRMVANGQECYPCFDVRRKFWADKNQKALNALLKGDSNEKDAHAEARRAKVCNDKKYKAKGDIMFTDAEARQAKVCSDKKYKAKEEIKFTTTKAKEAFDQRFVEGRFVPLRKYASQRGLDAPETLLDTDLAKIVIEKFWQRVKRCEVTGVLGIETPVAAQVRVTPDQDGRKPN